MTRSRFARCAGLTAVVAGLTVAGAPAAAKQAPSMRVERAPARVTAGGSMQVIVKVGGLTRCTLRAGPVSATAPVTGADRVTFSLTVSRTARPGRYTLTLRCGTLTKRLTTTVRPRAGKRGTSRKLVKGRIRFAVRAAPRRQPAPAPAPAPAPPAPAPVPAPVVPGPGNSFRAVYGLASDQVADPGHPAAIVATINAVNGWFATQTIGAVVPRWIRDAQGALVVSTVQLPHTVAEYQVGGLELVRDDLQAAAPPAAPTQKSVVWMDVTSPEGCGVTGYGISWIAEATCDIHPAVPAIWPFTDTYLTAHEMAHNFGAVPDCAPHGTGNGHVNDDPRDILYTGPLPRAWANQMLDPGRDDYYGTGTACGDIATSAFWTATS